MSLHTHLSALARQNDCKLYALKARVNNDTITRAVAQIRERGLTFKKARAAFDEAEKAFEAYQNNLRKGAKRRAKARVASRGSVEDRKARMIRKLLDRLPGDYYSSDTKWNVEAVKPGQGHASTETWKDFEAEYSGNFRGYYMTAAEHKIGVCLGDLLEARRQGLPGNVIESRKVQEGVFEVKILESHGKQARTRKTFMARAGLQDWKEAKTERGALTVFKRAMKDDLKLRAKVEKTILVRDFAANDHAFSGGIQRAM